VFVISTEDQLFGWGRNIQGQLGMGFMSESVPEPTPITTLADMRI
jgi:alpha-tubulin suppressor-like RCC1 family protein